MNKSVLMKFSRSLPDSHKPLQTLTYVSFFGDVSKMKKTIILFLLSITTLFLEAEPYRKLTGKDPSGYTLELDDGSVWRVLDSSLSKAKDYYREGDLIVIYPVLFPFFSGSKFFFSNLNSGQNVNVDLSLGPISGKPGCVEIDEIDFYRGRLLLRDGNNNRLIWQINTDYLSNLRQWKPGQCVILGSNRRHSNYLGSVFEYMLINVERLDCIQANMA
jgi:hypothetical protein